MNDDLSAEIGGQDIELRGDQPDPRKSNETPAGGSHSALDFMLNTMVDFGSDPAFDQLLLDLARAEARPRYRYENGHFVDNSLVKQMMDQRLMDYLEEANRIDDSDIRFLREAIFKNCDPIDGGCETNVEQPYLSPFMPPLPEPEPLEPM